MSATYGSRFHVMADLTLRTVTRGSQVILPMYPLVFFAKGLLFIFQSPERTAGARYEIALELLPIWGWGVIFLAVALVEVCCFLTRKRLVFVYALILGTTLCTFWGGLLLAAAAQDVHASWTPGLWLLFAAVAHTASARSLTLDYVLPRRP